MISIPFLIIVFILSFFLIFAGHKFFIKKNLIDKINKRSSHNVLATRSGGIAIYLSLFLISSCNYFIGNTIFDYSILIPLALLVAIGSYDDIYSIDFKLKFIFQIIAAKMIIDTGLLIDNFHGIFGIFEIDRGIAQILTIFIILSIVNAINFIDGIDALAICVVGVFIILFEYFSIEHTPYINLSYLLLASMIPLFFLNVHKNSKVFLGDSGSYFLGGVVSIYVVYILSNHYIIKDSFDIHKILFVFSILSYPIIDLIRVVILRIKNGKSPFIADKNHLHHLLVKKFKSHIIVTLIILFLVLILFGLIQIIF
ncbi:MAG: undecaprenyl/decaprenyl-phosphate alpha-N-acetylglucosaminyl 1-phosphate transferase [Flavobacteriaceae bacterium]|nr:undecaprenyl/decaprenyl-phosphate alpha-N-acetylglucosaminyl 1-phosphate transferase [Flavobacteriaceae bacterium]